MPSPPFSIRIKKRILRLVVSEHVVLRHDQTEVIHEAEADFLFRLLHVIRRARNRNDFSNTDNG